MHGLDLIKKVLSSIHGHMELRVLRNLIFLIIMQVGVIIKFCHVVVGFVWIFEFFMMFFAFVFSWWCSSKCFCVISPLPNVFFGCDSLPSALVVTILSWCSCVWIPFLIVLNGCDLLPWRFCVFCLLPSVLQTCNPLFGVFCGHDRLPWCTCVYGLFPNVFHGQNLLPMVFLVFFILFLVLCKFKIIFLNMP